MQLEACKNWSEIPEDHKERYFKQALTCAEIFQRSSSCVEGRNGQLSLKNHSFHNISKRKLKALTIVHNYFIKRPNGSTAAERFFEEKPIALFDYLLKNLDFPALPAARRRAA